MEKLCKKYPIRKPGYNTRSSQSIFQYGVGAMVDFPDQTLMTASPEFWENGVTEIHDTRLEKALEVKYFGMPGTRSDNKQTNEGISYVRFPEWYFCPVCRRFRPLKEWIEDHQKLASEKAKTTDPYMMNVPRCYYDRCTLVAAGLVTICKNGHIDDFPWVEWAHFKNIPSKPVCSNPKLKFRTGTSLSEGLQGLIVECETCHSSAILKDAFTPGVFQSLVEGQGHTEFCCKGKHPWRGSRIACGEYPITKQRGDTSVYFPCIVSSIVIPTNADENTNLVLESRQYQKILTILEDCDDEDERVDTIRKKIDKWSETIANETMLKTLSVQKILKKYLIDCDNDNRNIGIDSAEYRYEEYSALSGLDERTIRGSEDFLREEMNIGDYNIPGLEKVVLVKKIREVTALIGFSRVEPVNASDIQKANFVSVKENETEWYPGYEVRGEGIFLQFDQQELNKWKRTPFVIHRQEMMLENYHSSTMGQRMGEKPDAVFVFLHTLSHLLLKQLSFECGYNIASLRERLYYMPQVDSDSGMAGILLYTASGDSEGTLGGLVRQGRSDCFTRIFKEAIDKARMCSNDPVCITSMGQGRESLNLASCHACGLIPETSCEKFNILLDRALVIGTFEEPEAGFYSEWNLNP